MGRLETHICGLTLANPLIAASGTAGFGYEQDYSCLGAISLKGTTLEPRYGNPTPRIAEAPSGMINSVGLQNPGIEAVTEEEIPRLRALYSGKVIANISGFSVEEYALLAARLDEVPGVDMIEINISCPNVHSGGMSFGIDPSLAAKVTRAARKATAKPLIVKLSPNVTDITAIARASAEEGADALSLINTITAMRIDIRSRRPVLASTTGGLSGPAIFPVAERMVYEVYDKVDIPIIGMGGVATASDVIEMMMAGASAVGIGAAALEDPGVYEHILSGLPSLMDSLGIECLSDIVGIAHTEEPG